MIDLRLTVVTPVGPGHDNDSYLCADSVLAAWRHSPGLFDSFEHVLADDTRGEMGCGKARNSIIQNGRPADWYFIIDADDEACPDCFRLFEKTLAADPSLIAVFGAIFTKRLNEKHPAIIDENVHPLDWDGLLRLGAFGTLSVGFFVRADVARATPFDEVMIGAEDFDFYLRALHNRHWAKIPEPLVMIHRDTPSSSGPKGFADFKWREACQVVVDKWKAEVPTAR